MRILVMVAFFLSGLSGLVLETIWVHELTLFFGGSTLAITTVLTAYMGGLALGSYLGGRFSHAINRPIRVYGLLEVCVAIYAFCLPFAFDTVPMLLDWLPPGSPFWAKATFRFVLCTGMLLFPTILMGATLPVLSCYIANQQSKIGEQIGRLYSLNTFGAVAGALASGFILLPYLGHKRSVWLVAGALLALGLLLVWLGGPSLEPSTPKPKHKPNDKNNLFLIACISITGATAMGLQVLWSRALSMVIGSSTYAFTIVLSTFLIGLAGGAAIGAWLIRRDFDPRVSWGVTLALTIGFLGLGTTYIDQLPELFIGLVRTSQILETASPSRLFIIEGIISAIPILLPTLCMGAFFPLSLGMAKHDKQRVGQSIGWLYAANTFGSIIGTIIAGFVLIPVLGLETGIRVCIVAYALCILILARQAHPHRMRLQMLALGGVVLACMVPKWDIDAMTVGHFRMSTIRQRAQYSQLNYGKAPEKPTILFHKDGLSATVTVQQLKNGEVILKINGKVDATSHGDDSTQIGLALLPFLFHDQPKDALIIGWGSGMTAGAALRFPLRTLVAIELEPEVLRASRYFSKWNFRPRNDKRLTTILEDGRTFLATTERTFDVIISEPSNPWISGVSNLFTVEFFRQSKRKLRKNGIFCQWIQVYNLSNKHVFSILRSIRTVYQHVALFETGLNGGDTLLLASNSPLQRDILKLQTRLQQPHIRALIQRVKWPTLSRLMLHTLLETKGLDRLLKQSKPPLNTDDHNLLTYFAPLDLLYSNTNKKSHSTFQQRIAPYRQSTYELFTHNGRPISFSSHASLWYQQCMALFSEGELPRATYIIQQLSKHQPTAQFVPQLKRLRTYFEKDASLPHSASTPAREKAWRKAYEKAPLKTCLRVILPVTKQNGWETRISANAWYDLGQCFKRIKQPKEATYSFFQYIQKTSPRKQPQPLSRPSSRPVRR